MHLDVALELVSSFHTRKLTGCPRSNEYFDLQRMDLHRGHRPIGTKQKIECVVCSKQGYNFSDLTGDIYESRVTLCSYYDVHLSIDKDRKYFMKYHADIQHWL